VGSKKKKKKASLLARTLNVECPTSHRSRHVPPFLDAADAAMTNPLALDLRRCILPRGVSTFSTVPYVLIRLVDHKKTFQRMDHPQSVDHRHCADRGDTCTQDHNRKGLHQLCARQLPTSLFSFHCVSLEDDM